MTGGYDPFPFPADDEVSPVAEYRDPELVRRFAVDTVPEHGAHFWSRIDRTIGVAASATPTSTSTSTFTSTPTPDSVSTGGLAPTALELVGAPAPAPAPVPPVRWTSSRWLAAAAAVLVVAGIGGVLLAVADRPSSSVESADEPTTVPSVAPSTTANVDQPSTTPTEATTTTATASSSTAAEGTVDYFGATKVTGIGRGRAVGFSPDDSAILVLDDAPGVELGCEGAELLTLYTQDLATGGRRATLGPGSTIESGGIAFRQVALDAPAPTPGTRTVYWDEFCDGSILATRRGQLSPDGLLSMVDEVDTASVRDVLTAPVAVEGPDGTQLPSPDGRFELSIVDGAVTVVAVETREPVDVPEEVRSAAVQFGVWAPHGEVVALAGPSKVVVWNHVTGDHRIFNGARAHRLLFDNEGRRLALVSLDGVPSTSVLSFGDLPLVVPAAPRCSGDVDLAPLDLDALTDAGLPTEVLAKAAAIDTAAAGCDWAALARLAGDDFVASFGGGDPVAVWQEAEAGFGSPMWILRTVLRQPFGIVEEEPDIFAWPELYLREGCDYDQADLGVLERLGYPEGEALYQCDLFGGYAGYRTGIDRSGRWRFFVAGD